MTKPRQPSSLERILSSWTSVLFFLICFAISQSWIIMTLGNTGVDVGKLQTMCLRYPTSPSQTGTAARMILQDWTSQDIHDFQRHFLLDLWLHPILYALFFASALLYDLTYRWQDNDIDNNDDSISISKTKQLTTSSRIFYGRLGTIIIFGAALCDILENIRHHSIQFEPNNKSNAVIASDQMLYEACIFASTKWFIMGVVSIWLIWRYFYSPSNAKVTAFIHDQTICSTTTIHADPDNNSWNGPCAQDFLNSPGDMGLLDVQDRKIPWTLTHPNSYQDMERSYTVSPYAHYVGYAIDEIPIHLANRPILSFLAKALINAFGYIFHSLCFDDCIYFNNFRLSTNIWPGGKSIEWSQAQVENINLKLQSVIRNNSNSNVNRQVVDRAIVWRSVDALSQPKLTKVLSESATCLMIPARVVNWTEFQGDFENSDSYQKKDFQKDIQLFRNRVGWDIIRQESTVENSTAKYFMATLEPSEMTMDDAIQIVDLYNQLYIDKYSRRNPQLTPEGLVRLTQNGFFSVDVLRLRATAQPTDTTPGRIAGFCTWSVMDDIASSAFVGYDIAQDHDKDLYRLVMMMIHSNLVRSGVKKCHLSGGANQFKRRRGASSTIEYNAVFIDHLPYYQQIPWIITKRIAGKVITVDRAK